MAKELVLVSHGRFCEELKASTEMIMGPQESIHTVALLPEEGPEDFTAKFEATVQGLEDYIVFADLLGGTPCNTVSRLNLDNTFFCTFRVVPFITSQATIDEFDDHRKIHPCV